MRADDDRSRSNEDIFHALRDRETPELDSEATWRRLRAVLPERQPGSVWAPGWRLAATAATVALATVLFLWQGLPQQLQPGVDGRGADTTVADDAGEVAAPAPSPSTDDGDLVLLAGAPAATDEPAEATESAAAAPMHLDVRLLREGAPDAPALATGGADATADIRSTLRAVQPEGEYGVLGWWESELGAGAVEAELAPGYRLSFEVDPENPRLLRRVRLSGDRGPVVADEIRLEPGRVYVFGVRGTPEQQGELLLAVRLRAAGADPDAADPDNPGSRDPGPDRD